MRMLALWAAVAVAIACGPTPGDAFNGASFNGAGTPLNSFPGTSQAPDFGRDLTASQEVTNLSALFPNQPAGNGDGWYYRYGPVQPGDNQVGATKQFVPMFYNAADVTAPNLASATAAASPWIMGFNEPDVATQANMTVAQACTLWPQLEATGKKLISPACSNNMNVGGSWCDQFITGSGCTGGYVPRIDAIAIHNYTTNVTDTVGTNFLAYVDAVYSHYAPPTGSLTRRPIVISEFGVINFGAGGLANQTYCTAANCAAFIKSVVPQLRTRMLTGEVMRWSWYPDVVSQAALNDWGSTGIGNIALANPDGTLTTLGTTYSGLDQAPANDVPSTAFAQVFVLPPNEERKRRVRRPHTRMRRAA